MGREGSVRRVKRVARQGLDHLMAFGKPVAQIDELAALAAERTPGVLGVETARRAALGASPQAGHCFHLAHRVQHCIRNGTSTPSCVARSFTEATVMKRMLKRCRLALISGKVAIDRGTWARSR